MKIIKKNLSSFHQKQKNKLNMTCVSLSPVTHMSFITIKQGNNHDRPYGITGSILYQIPQ